ncbi:MAG: efflux RND transporter periplasmic adaptor subunit [Prochlorococcus sp.]
MATTERHPTPDEQEQGLARLTRLSGKRRQQRRWIGITAAVVLLAGAGLFWKLGPGRGNRDLTPYTVEARQGSLPGVISASGELEAERRVNVSPNKQGRLEQLFVEEGDRVKKGDVLAQMDNYDYLDRLQELQALKRQANAEYKTSANEYKRQEWLYKQGGGAISFLEYNASRSRYLTNLEALNAAKERLQQREVEGGELMVRAPFSGTITARYAEPGAFVTPTTTASATAGATSSSVVELSEGLLVAAKVPESDIGRIRIGQKASVRVDAFPDQKFSAEVSEIAPRAEKQDNVTSFEVKLKLLNRSPRLLIGMNADVDFQTGRTATRTLVPTVAIVTKKGKPGVLEVGKNEQPRFQPVELGSSSGSQTAIVSGLEPGTRLFIDLPPWAAQQRD